MVTLQEPVKPVTYLHIWEVKKCSFPPVEVSNLEDTRLKSGKT